VSTPEWWGKKQKIKKKNRQRAKKWRPGKNLLRGNDPSRKGKLAYQVLCSLSSSQPMNRIGTPTARHPSRSPYSESREKAGGKVSEVTRWGLIVNYVVTSGKRWTVWPGVHVSGQLECCLLLIIWRFLLLTCESVNGILFTFFRWSHVVDIQLYSSK
jgi:hypothetical protein